MNFSAIDQIGMEHTNTASLKKNSKNTRNSGNVKPPQLGNCCSP